MNVLKKLIVRKLNFSFLITSWSNESRSVQTKSQTLPLPIDAMAVQYLTPSPHNSKSPSCVGNKVHLSAETVAWWKSFIGLVLVLGLHPSWWVARGTATKEAHPLAAG